MHFIFLFENSQLKQKNWLCGPFLGPDITDFGTTKVEFDTSTLYLSTNDATFEVAKFQCENAGDGFYLATLTDEIERDNVFEITGGKISPTRTGWYGNLMVFYLFLATQAWIGLTADLTTECMDEACDFALDWEGNKGPYIHQDLGYQTTFNGIGLACGRTRPQGGQIDIHDKPCSDSYQFICQRDKPEACLGLP